ncbi:BQ2448_4607 [Microbotryum intermedium]|uniref:BQ2448_4607 protein n=1 Tax=Microbotryum intermedium TaxID=269621 RepID=A0A238FIT6_9BASI|nr:BQ2448_4607 [Microbotryum intermedium]
MRPPTPLPTPTLSNLSRPISILSPRPSPLPTPASSSGSSIGHNPRHRPFSRSTRLWANEQDHYATLGVSRSASRNEIKDKFYEVSRKLGASSGSRGSRGKTELRLGLSRKYHPDAPTVSSESVETRTARFQTLSQSYSVLSDETSRRQYDSTLGGGGWGRTTSYGSRPRYTSGAAHEVGRSGFGGGAGAAWSWTSTENQARRERANYAWSHPTRARKNGPTNNEQYQEQQQQQAGNPFNPARDTRTSDEHFQTFAAREARMRGRGPAAMSAKGGFNSSGSSRFSSGTANFGAKADEENRLINDSSTKRTGQVALVFLMTFVVAASFGGNKRDSYTVSTNDKRRP